MRAAVFLIIGCVLVADLVLEAEGMWMFRRRNLGKKDVIVRAPVVRDAGDDDVSCAEISPYGPPVVNGDIIQAAFLAVDEESGAGDGILDLDEFDTFLNGLINLRECLESED